MLIRLLIFSTLVLAVNLVAGIFAKDQTDQHIRLKNQDDFSTKGETPRSSTRLYGSSRYSDSFGTQRDSANVLNKPKITKRFAKEERISEGEKRNLTRLAERRSSLPRDERRSTEFQKSITGMRIKNYHIKSIDRSKESLESEESAHGLPTRTPATVSIIGLSSSPAEKLLLQSMSSDNEDLGDENEVAKNNKTFERREIKENLTGVKNETGKDGIKNDLTETSDSPLKTNATTTAATPVSTSLRKRRPSAVIRLETPVSPLPVAAALTMSESLYNHFRPLDKEVPEDHLLPFLDFGKKLITASAKSTSPVGSSSSTSSTNSIEATGTSPRTPPVGQYNLLNATPQKVLSSNTRKTHTPREDEIHEDMDVSVVKSVVEKNKASRTRGNSLQFLRNLRGLYHKHGTSTSEVVASSSTVRVTPASSTENALKTEETTKNYSGFDYSSKMKSETVNSVSTPSSSTGYPATSQGTHKNPDLGSRSTTEVSKTSVNNHFSSVTNLSSHTTEVSKSIENKYQSSKISDISEQLALFPTSQPGVPTQLSASSSHVEATVSTPFVIGRPPTTVRNSFPSLSRRPSIYQHFYRNSNIASKSSNPSHNTSKFENIPVYRDNKAPEKLANLASASFTSGPIEKSVLARTSLIPLLMLSTSPNMYGGRNESVNGTTIVFETKVNMSELMNTEEKLIVNQQEQYAQGDLPTKTNGSLFEDTVNNSSSNISSQTLVESVTAEVIISTSLQNSEINVTAPPDLLSITSSVQSPTTKILSTAVVTSVSVKGAWPVMVTDTPPSEPTLISPESSKSQNTKNESVEHVLYPPERYDTNQTQSNIKELATRQIHNVTTAANRTLPRQLPINTVGINTSSSGNFSSTNVHKEVNVASENPKFTTGIKAITSDNSNNTTHIDHDEYEESNTKTHSVNKSEISQTPEPSTSKPTAEEGALSVASNTETNGSATETQVTNTDSALTNSHGRGVTYPPTSSVIISKSVTWNPVPQSSRSSTDTPTALPETTRTKDVTHTLHQYGTRKGHTRDTHFTSTQVTMKSLASDSEFDIPLLKLYNTSTVWSVPARGAAETTDESHKSVVTEYPGTGNETIEVTNNVHTMINATKVSINNIGIVNGVTKATESANTTSDIHEGESRNGAIGKDRKEEARTRASKDADVPNNASAVSNGGTNRSLGVGNVFSRNTTVGSPRPADSVEAIGSASIVLYVLSALGVVPLTIGVALAARYCVRRRRKLLDDTDAYSDISSRRDARSGGGQTGSDIGSPVSGTKLPRVHTHLSWDQEKASTPIVPMPTTRWEFPRSKLRLQTVLGQGNFGQVLKAEADDISGHEGTTRLVAVKTVKEGASSHEKEDLLRELEIMQQLGSHANVVTLLGCCTEKEPYLLIMEYVMYGKLLAFLRDHRTRQHYYNFSEDSDALTSRDLTIFAYCVARGMEYLGSKGIIHRDLAARNVLVDHNKLCKIADFGMSRNVRETGDMYEQQHTKGALPIRWMAPESLHYRIFTHKSDVWSFGILMWEIVTLGSTPYPTMGAREVMRRVRDGYRLERPSHCRIELFRVISRCWNADPNKRPEFAALRHEIGALIEASKDGGGYVDLESFAESNKYSYNRSEDESSSHHHHHHHHNNHHNPGSTSAALGSRIAGEEEIMNM